MYITVDETLLGHVKLVALQSLLGSSQSVTLGHIVSLWLNVMRREPSGDISNWPNKAIAIYSGWDGDHDLFVDSLIETGWLDKGSDGLCVHDWNQRYHKLRAAIRKKKSREKQDEVDSNPPQDESVGHSWSQPVTKCHKKTAREREREGERERDLSNENHSKKVTQCKKENTSLLPTGTNPSLPAIPEGNDRDAIAEHVVAHWRTLVPTSKRTKSKLQLVRARLADECTAEEMCEALNKIAASDWHRKNHQVRFELALQSADKIEYWLNQDRVKTVTEKNMELIKRLANKENKDGPRD
jgi:uncharacterized protein YbdZ (MbtH family)